MIIGLDIDGVLCDFIGGFYKTYRQNLNTLKRWDDIFVSSFFHEITNKEDDFWRELLPCCDSKLVEKVDYYITSRATYNFLTEKWLKKWGFPEAPVHTIGNNKTQLIKELKIDFFLDDKPENYFQINSFTNCQCYLKSADYNEYVDTDKRVDSIIEFYKRIKNEK